MKVKLKSALVALLVRDHNEAIEFYVGKLSFRSGRIDFPQFINRGIAI